jgi:hypothetical protein
MIVKVSVPESGFEPSSKNVPACEMVSALAGCEDMQANTSAKQPPLQRRSVRSDRCFTFSFPSASLPSWVMIYILQILLCDSGLRSLIDPSL